MSTATVTTGTTTVTESYLYDWAGTRTAKITDGVLTYYLVDTGGVLSQVLAELDHTGALITHYTRGAELISLSRPGEKYYYLHDGHGSVRALSDADGQVTDTYIYDAFGNLLSKTGTTANDFLYTGEQYDINTGFYYLRARYMNPATGTFTSPDAYAGTIFDPVSLHKYLYANANPVMNRDPSGYYTIADGVVTFSIVEILAAAVVCVGFVAILGILQHNGYAPISVRSIVDGFVEQDIIGNISIRTIDAIRNALLNQINAYFAKWFDSIQDSSYWGGSSGSPYDPDDPNNPKSSKGGGSNQDNSLKKIDGNKQANEVARNNGYENAEALKADYVSKNNVSQFNIMRNTRTGEIILQKISDSSVQISTGLFG